MATIETVDPMGPSRAIVVVDLPARIGGYAIIIAVAIIFLWFGCLKFTAYEQSGVAGFIMNNPLIAWLHGVFGTGGGAEFLGVFEILTGLLIAGSLAMPRLGVIGGIMGMLTFFVTLICLFTTPGVVQFGFDNPLALSAVPGQFLLKDLGLFAACVWIAGTSLSTSRSGRRLA